MPMPKPKQDEEQTEFISRFMSDEAMKKEYPDEKQRLAVAFDTWRGENSLANEHSARVKNPDDFKQESFRRKNISPGVDIIIGRLKGEETTTTQAYRFDESKFTVSEAKKWLKDNDVSYSSFDKGEAENFSNSKSTKDAKKYRCNFIEPGLVSYEKHGNVLLRKSTIDKFLNTFIGKPVINLIHKETGPEDFSNGDADGIVTDVGYDSDNGFYYADFIVWDDETKKNCDNSTFAVSCAYDVTDFKEGKGTHNNIEYEFEILDGNYNHLAIVDNPRYEDSKIIRNSNGGKEIMKFRLFKNEDKDKKKETPKEEKVINVDEDSIINLDGKEFSVKDMIEATLEREKIKEAQKKNEEEKKKEEEEKKNQEEEERKKKEEEDMLAQKEEEEKKKEMENSLKDKKHFEDLKNAALKREKEIPVNYVSRSEMFKEGEKRYGSKK